MIGGITMKIRLFLLFSLFCFVLFFFSINVVCLNDVNKDTNTGNIPTISVGLLDSYDQSEEILGNNRADLVAFGRALLRNPYLPLNMAFENNIDIEYPEQYYRGFKR